MNNETLSDALDQFADLMSLEHADARQLAAYRHAATVVRNWVRPVADLVEEDGVEGLHHLGLDYQLAGMLTDWIRFGQKQLLEKIAALHARAIAHVPGLGPELTKTLQAEGIATVEALEEVAHEGRLADICGFGPRRIELVLAALAALSRRSRRPVQLSLGIDQRAA